MAIRLAADLLFLEMADEQSRPPFNRAFAYSEALLLHRLPSRVPVRIAALFWLGLPYRVQLSPQLPHRWRVPAILLLA